MPLGHFMTQAAKIATRLALDLFTNMTGTDIVNISYNSKGSAVIARIEREFERPVISANIVIE